jgi:hypothetical protein
MASAAIDIGTHCAHYYECAWSFMSEGSDISDEACNRPFGSFTSQLR